MENNIMQNAINYLAQSLCITPDQLIDAYAAQGQAYVYMCLSFVVLLVVLIVALVMLYRIKDNENPIVDIAKVFLSMGLIFFAAILLILAYDAYLWICDPRAYAIKELLADIKLWK